MVWEQVEAEVTRPHVSYAVTGFALILFGTISLFLKEKLYIGEATVATIYGLIVGPHCLNWFAPTTWGNSDYITIEISRIVLIVQIFAVAVELPKMYMLKHWWSVTILLIPVMTFGWVVSSVFIWKLVPTLRWIQALCIAGCVTATDPVLASAVVGKGKFAKRVPGHLRNLLSAESGCNDGMAYPFVMMAAYILKDEHHPAEIARDFICITVLYGCVLGILIGCVIGYGTRHLIKFAERMNLIDRESFLVYYFCVAMFCAGVGTLCGVDDLLVAFSAGAAFSWDGWFAKQTEESHVSNVIDVLLNTAFFVYFGAIVPWPDFNNFDIGIKAWKLVCLAIIILVVRRIPIMLAIKPITPDIHTWREALFCGHFGPIGVGAIFMALLARATFETNSETPSLELPLREDTNYFLVATIWPITCFLVIASIAVHGSSIAVFTLGKRINNMAITLTYTTGGNEPSWMSRLPSRRSSQGGNMLQLQRMETEEPLGQKFTKKKRRPRRPSTLKRSRRNSGALDEHHGASGTDASAGPGHAPNERIPDDVAFHENRPEGDAREHHHPIVNDDDKSDEQAEYTLDLRLTLKLDDEVDPVVQTEKVDAKKLEGKELSDINVYREGDHVIVEDKDGDFIHKFEIGDRTGGIEPEPHLEIIAPERPEENNTIVSESRTGTDTSYDEKDGATSSDAYQSGQSSVQRPRRRSMPRMQRTRSTLPTPSGSRAYAYMIDDLVIVENADGDILRRYKYVPRGGAPASQKSSGVMSKLRNMLPWKKAEPHDNASEDAVDVEHAPQPMLVPEETGPPLSEAASRAISVEDEDNIRHRLSQMLTRGEIDRRPSRRTSDVGLPLGSNSQTVRSQAVSDADDEEYTDYENADDDDDVEPETAVERHRRLAALGVIPNTEEEENDLEHGQDGGEEEPKITFMLPDRHG